MESLGFPSGYALFEGNDSTLVQIRIAQTFSFLEVCGLAGHLEEPLTAEKHGLRWPDLWSGCSHLSPLRRGTIGGLQR